MESRLEQRIEQRKKRNKRIMVIGFMILVFLVSAAYGYNHFSSSDTDALSNGQANDIAADHHAGAAKKINILILGIDERRNDIGRSNVTCVATVDFVNNHVSLFWVPRDSRVDIPGHEWNKIGHAYAYGGPRLSEQTVANLLGIPIDYYVSVNMDGFKKVIDAMGGVDINVEKRMHYYDPYDEGEVDNNGLIDLKPGLQHMDGNTALQYVRFRHDEMGDIGRIERQQKFMKAVTAEIVQPSTFTKIPEMLRLANAAFSTDMPASEMLRLSKVATGAYKQGVLTDMMAGKPVYIDNISYWLPNITAMRDQVAQLEGIQEDNSYLLAARSLADRYKENVARKKVIDAP